MAARADDKPEAGIFSLVFENDLFAGNDRNYTNGAQASWLSGPSGTPDWALRVARLFPLFPAGGTVRIGYTLGQNMYAPSDITLENPPLDDRPYAGWLLRWHLRLA